MISKKSIAITLAFSSVLLATAAEARTKWVDVNGQATIQQIQVPAKSVNGMAVYATDGKKIGKVEEAVGTSATKPKALVVDLDKASPYGAHRNLVVPLNDFTRTDGRLVMTAAPDAVAKMGTHAASRHASNTTPPPAPRRAAPAPTPAPAPRG